MTFAPDLQPRALGAAEGPPGDAPAGRAPGARRRSSPLCVLHVEDQDPEREIVARVLQAAGVHVRSAASLVAAGRVLEDQGEALDVVLVDLDLGDAGGLEVVETLRPELADHVVLVVLSGSSDPTLRRRARRAGAADWIEKPARYDAAWGERLADRLLELVHRPGAEGADDDPTEEHSGRWPRVAGAALERPALSGDPARDVALLLDHILRRQDDVIRDLRRLTQAEARVQALEAQQAALAQILDAHDVPARREDGSALDLADRVRWLARHQRRDVQAAARWSRLGALLKDPTLRSYLWPVIGFFLLLGVGALTRLSPELGALALRALEAYLGVGGALEATTAASGGS